MTEVKTICAKCVHVRRPKSIYLDPMIDWDLKYPQSEQQARCLHPNLEIVNPVNGKVSFPLCHKINCVAINNGNCSMFEEDVDLPAKIAEEKIQEEKRQSIIREEMDKEDKLRDEWEKSLSWWSRFWIVFGNFYQYGVWDCQHRVYDNRHYNNYKNRLLKDRSV